MGRRGRRAPHVEEGGRETQLPRQIAILKNSQAAARPARQVIFAAKEKRTPVLRPEFAAEHAGLLGFGPQPGPRVVEHP